MRPGPLTDAPRSLSPGTAYLVLENIRELSLSLERLVKVLSQAERERVARYRFEDDFIFCNLKASPVHNMSQCMLVDQS